MLKTTFDFKPLWRGKKKIMSGPHPPNAHLWGISTELQRVPRGGELNQQLFPPAPPRLRAIHEHTHVHPHTENLAVGLSPPHGMGGLSTVLCRGPQNILVILDSRRMLILSQLSHCTVKSGSYSQSLLLLSSPPFSLSILFYIPPSQNDKLRPAPVTRF